MLKSTFRVAVVAVGLGLASVAGAVPLSFTDVVDPDDIFVTNNGVNSPYSFVHDILNDGFNPLTDILTSVSLTLRFRDDADQQPETVTIGLDNVTQGTFPITSKSTAQSPSLTVLQIAQGLLQNDGLLSTVLIRGMGDYWFMDSTLVVQAERGSDTSEPNDGRLPEPATGFLTGLGLVLAGLVGQRRRSPGRCRKI